MRVTPVESEMMKYYWNTFNATRITFANVFYEICKSNGAEYDRVKEAFLRSSNMPDEYLDVKPELRGYGGACLPKDVLAMDNACKKLGIPNKLFEYIDKENKLFKKTVFKGMRK
jgi:UDP-glucose 6-dehydrogenase